MTGRAVFLDRDGTLIEERGYLKDPKLVRLIPGVRTALHDLRANGWRMALVTNQSGIARGLMTVADVDEVNSALLAALGQPCPIDAIYVCPHAPGDGCACRKPAPGLMRRASDQLALDPRQCYVVGDKLDDLDAGRAIGCRAILVLTGHGASHQHAVRPGDEVAADLPTAARIILRAQEAVTR